MRTLAALLALALPASEVHADPAPCVKKSDKKIDEPATLDALIVCQKAKFSQAEAAHLAKTGKAPDDFVKERWRDRQVEEVADYAGRHPDRAKAKTRVETAKKPAAEPDARQVKRLEQSLQEMSDGGKKGITPEMAQKIVDYLKEQQGGVSPDMERLLEALKKDGVDLSIDTMSKLQDAAKKAEAAGLELPKDKTTQEVLKTPLPQDAETRQGYEKLLEQNKGAGSSLPLN